VLSGIRQAGDAVDVDAILVPIDSETIEAGQEAGFA
jgi:hypothetical protein